MNDETFRLERRLRRRERRQFRRLQVVVPIAFVTLAMLLSAGVVEVMEAPRPPTGPAARAVPAEPVQGTGTPASHVPMAPPPGGDVQTMLSTSILDGEVEEPVAPDAGTPTEAASPQPVDGPVDPDAGAQLRMLAPPTAVPQPGTGVLMASGLVWLAFDRRAGDPPRTRGRVADPLPPAATGRCRAARRRT